MLTQGRLELKSDSKGLRILTTVSKNIFHFKTFQLIKIKAVPYSLCSRLHALFLCQHTPQKPRSPSCQMQTTGYQERMNFRDNENRKQLSFWSFQISVLESELYQQPGRTKHSSSLPKVLTLCDWILNLHLLKEENHIETLQSPVFPPFFIALNSKALYYSGQDFAYIIRYF